VTADLYSWDERVEGREEILTARGFEDVRIELLEHEAAVVFARQPQLAHTKVGVR
jgi:hypothetical protein